MGMTTLASTSPRNGGGVAASAPRPLPVRERPVVQSQHIRNAAGQLGPNQTRVRGIVNAAVGRS